MFSLEDLMSYFVRLHRRHRFHWGTLVLHDAFKRQETLISSVLNDESSTAPALVNPRHPFRVRLSAPFHPDISRRSAHCTDCTQYTSLLRTHMASGDGTVRTTYRPLSQHMPIPINTHSSSGKKTYKTPCHARDTVSALPQCDHPQILL